MVTQNSELPGDDSLPNSTRTRRSTNAGRAQISSTAAIIAAARAKKAAAQKAEPSIARHAPAKQKPALSPADIVARARSGKPKGETQGAAIATSNKPSVVGPRTGTAREDSAGDAPDTQPATAGSVSVWAFLITHLWGCSATIGALCVISMHLMFNTTAEATIVRTWQGEWLGLLSTLLILFPALLAFVSSFPKSMQKWLRGGHIPMALLGALAITLHSGLRLGGLFTLALWCNVGMLFCSGILQWHFQRVKVVAKPSQTASAKVRTACSAINGGFSLWTQFHLALTYSLVVLICGHVFLVLWY